jgi:hypothetical protein
MNAIFLAIARVKANNYDPDFDIGSMEAIANNDTLLKCYKTQPITKGKNKGQKKYVGTATIVVISQDEIKAEEARYERMTGNCQRCFGNKQIAKSWSKDEGTVYRDCPRCKGTGLRPGPADQKDGIR